MKKSKLAIIIAIIVIIVAIVGIIYQKVTSKQIENSTTDNMVTQNQNQPNRPIVVEDGTVMLPDDNTENDGLEKKPNTNQNKDSNISLY